jgi:glutaredoxin-like protein NrdH
VTVTVYTKNNCQPCRATKRNLDAAGVEYVERNIDVDPDALDRLIAAGFREAPVVIVDRGPDREPLSWSGFRPDLIADHLA